MQQFQESIVEVSRLVASEQYCLYALFAPQALAKLMALMRQSSLRVLEQRPDPLGFNV